MSVTSCDGLLSCSMADRGEHQTNRRFSAACVCGYSRSSRKTSWRLGCRPDPRRPPLVEGDRVAVVEIAVQVNGEDVRRAVQRAQTLQQGGAQAMAMGHWRALGDAGHPRAGPHLRHRLER